MSFVDEESALAIFSANVVFAVSFLSVIVESTVSTFEVSLTEGEVAAVCPALFKSFSFLFAVSKNWKASLFSNVSQNSNLAAP